MATGRQIRAARALLGWDAKQLAGKSGVSERSLLNHERGDYRAKPENMEKIVKVLEDAGIEFLEGEGIRLRSGDVEVFEGHERFHEFTEFVYNFLHKHGGDVCIKAVDDRLFLKYRREPEVYRLRMKELVDSGSVTVRIMAEQSNFKSAFAGYRKLPSKSNSPISYYAFGDCFALISFAHNPSPHVVLMKHTPFAEAYRQEFGDDWDKAEFPE